MADKKGKQRGLGRGLSALMADVGDASTATAEQPRSPDRMVAIDLVLPNPDQPRRRFDEEKLEDLANSIAEKGIIQPLIVRSHPSKENHFEIVAGERRWRAAQRAKVHQVPVVIKEFNDTEVLEIAIIENIQRADLNPVEEAAGYAQLMEKFGHTQDKLSQALGKSRSHVANTLRLLKLPAEVRAMVEAGTISAGAARTVVTAEDPVGLARRIVAENLSVREAEALARDPDTAEEAPAAARAPARGRGRKVPEASEALKSEVILFHERRLREAAGFDVSITVSDGRPTITISLDREDDLDALAERLEGRGGYAAASAGPRLRSL